MARPSALLLVLLCLCSELPARSSPEAGEVGIDERLGSFVPADIGLLDEEGDSVTLGDLVDKPTVLALVYYRCPSICKPLLGAVADVVAKLDLAPGQDYRLLTVSFDPTDGPADSKRMKRDFTASLGDGFPSGAWSFLTGESTSIRRLTEAVGFRYRRQGADFIHPAALVVLSPERKIVRYLYGTTYLPFDVKMALAEAAQGSVGGTVVKVLKYCFSYDPRGNRYALDLTRIVGAVVLLFAGSFAVYLGVSTRRYRRKRRGREG